MIISPDEFDENGLWIFRDPKVALVDNNVDKNLNILKKIYNWIVWSSVNEDKISLTLKAGFPLLALWGISNTQVLTDLTGSAGNLVVSIWQVMTGLLTVFGLLRKIWYSYR